MIDYTQKSPSGTRLITCRKCGRTGLAERERYGAAEPVLVAVIHSADFDPETLEMTNVQRCEMVSGAHRQENRDVAAAETERLRRRCESF